MAVCSAWARQNQPWQWWPSRYYVRRPSLPACRQTKRMIWQAKQSQPLHSQAAKGLFKARAWKIFMRCWHMRPECSRNKAELTPRAVRHGRCLRHPNGAFGSFDWAPPMRREREWALREAPVFRPESAANLTFTTALFIVQPRKAFVMWHRTQV